MATRTDLIDALRAMRRFWTDPEFRANVIELIRTEDRRVREYYDKPMCAACLRRVTSPCNSREGYNEGGPWDSWCHRVVHPERYE